MSSSNSVICQFDLEAMHNGIKCVLSRLEEDQGTARQYRFTANMLSDMFSVGVDTIRRRVEILINTGDINETQNCDSLNIRNENGNGAVKTTIYDLNVFNKLAMTFIDNPKAVEIRKAFSDVLVKHETDTPKLPMSYADALRALAAEVEAKEATLKALAEEKEQHEADNRDFREGLDILNSKCAQIQTRQVQTALTTASIKSRECKRLANENENLKDKVGRGQNWRTFSEMKDYWIDKFHHKPQIEKLKEFCREIGILPIKDVRETYNVPGGHVRESVVNRYPIEAWNRYDRYEELLKGNC